MKVYISDLFFKRIVKREREARLKLPTKISTTFPKHTMNT